MTVYFVMPVTALHTLWIKLTIFSSLLKIQKDEGRHSKPNLALRRIPTLILLVRDSWMPALMLCMAALVPYVHYHTFVYASAMVTLD